MARALLYHERQSDGGWRPCGVFYGTTKRLDYRMLPGDGARDAWATSLGANASPPFLDGTGISPERGTWEDWIGWALGALSNGHDTWMTEVKPEATLDATYNRYVLKTQGKPITPPNLQPTEEFPELGGYKKVKPVR